MTQKIIPTISEMTEGEVKDVICSSESHDVPFGTMRVDAFFEGSLIREAAAQYWEPLSFCDDDPSNLWFIMHNIKPQGLQALDGPFDDYDFPIRAKIILTYPLCDIWEAEVEVPANRLGEIFGITHDMYLHIYELDDARWRSSGHQDQVPRAGRLLNRARSEHVWGHDMSDLIFEYVSFLHDPDWPKEKRGYFQSLPIPIDKEKHADKSPLIGTFTFFIGS